MRLLNGKRLFLSSVLGVSASVLCLGLVSCNWQLPERISVKTATELSVPLGTASVDVNEYLGMDKMLSTIRESLGSTADVYDYSRPGSAEDQDTLTYLVRYPMYQIPFDLGDFLGSMNVEDMLKDAGSGFNFAQDITIPSLDFPALDVTEKISDLLSDLIANGNKPVTGINMTGIPEGSGTELSCTGADGIKVNTGNSYAKGIKYSAGSAIEVNVTRKDSKALDPSFVVKMKATIRPCGDGEYKYNGSTSNFVEITNGGKIYLPLDNGILPADYSIYFDATCKGGSSASITHDYEISFKVKDGSGVDAIYEIDLTPENGDPAIVLDDIAIPESTVPFDSLPEQVVEMELGDASVNVVSELPAGWKNVKLNLKSFSLSGLGSNYDQDDFADVPGSGYMINKKLDLSGLKIDSSMSAKISGSVGIDVDGATVVLSESDSVTAKAAFEVKKIGAIALDLHDMGKSISDSTISIPDGTGDYLQKISFGENVGGEWKKKQSDGTYVDCEGLGIKCQIVDSFPVGSDIPVTITSNCLGLVGANEISAVISGKGNTEASSLSLVSHPEVVLSYGDIDFNVNFGADYTDRKGVTHSGIAKLVDIEPGKTYSLSITDAQLVCDWSSADVNMSGVKIKNQVDLNDIDIGTFLRDTPIPLEDIQKIKLDSLKTYFYAQKPSDSTPLAKKLGEIALSGDIWISYKRAGEDSYTDDYFLKDDGSNIHFVDAVTWPSKDTMDIISEENYPELVSALCDDKATFAHDLAPLINDLPSDMHMEYNLKLTKTDGSPILQVYPYDMVAGDPVSVGIDLVIEFPLALTLDGQISMNVMDFVRGDNEGVAYDDDNPPPDLLGREGAADLEKFAKYADSIDYFKLKYVVHNDVIQGFNGKITVRDNLTSTASGVETSCSFADGVQEAGLTGEQIKAILTHYPFNPDLFISFGEVGEKTEMRLSRKGLASNSSLGAKVIVDFKMDENKPIEIWQKNGDAGEGGY